MEVAMQVDVGRLYQQQEQIKSEYAVAKVEPASNSSEFAQEDSVDLSMSMSLKEINERMSTKIGRKLDEALKAEGVDLRSAAGLDWSPEATATRLFEAISGLLPVWEAQHPEMSRDEVVDSFESVIRDAIDLGYSQAMEVLEPLDIDDGVKAVAEETISLLHGKFDVFFMSLREELKERSSAPHEAERGSLSAGNPHDSE